VGPTGTTEPANWELTATDSSITGTGLLQLKWSRAGSATAANDVTFDDNSVSTLAPPAPEPPAAPSGLAGTATSSSAVALTWTDNADDETGYTVERSWTETTWTVATATLPAGATSYNNTGLTASTSYSSSESRPPTPPASSGYSNVDTVTTGAPAPEPPAAPSGLAGTATSSSAAALTWTDNADDETGYTVERSLDGTTWTVATAALPAGVGDLVQQHRD
jgi:hypothetical protein